MKPDPVGIAEGQFVNEGEPSMRSVWVLFQLATGSLIICAIMFYLVKPSRNLAGAAPGK